MSLAQPESAIGTCQRILKDGKQYNIEHNILPSENAIIDKLLVPSVDVENAFAEAFEALSHRHYALDDFLGTILSTAAFWCPDKIAEAREARDELNEVNRLIAERAEELAGLLERRSDLHNTSGFYSGTRHRVVDVIEAASESNPLFKWHVHAKLHALSCQFDWKYWPELSDCVRAIANDAYNAEPEAVDPMTAAATEARRPSRTDFFKALFAAFDENRVEFGGRLPNDFMPSDSALASLANCVLSLEPSELVDSAYVKRLRQRLRDKI